MNKLMALTRIQLKDFMSRYMQQLNLKSKFFSKLMILLPLAIVLPFIMIIEQFYSIFSAINAPELTVTYTYIAATMFVFLMSIPLVISVFFYSKDMTLIATLPVSERSVVFSKLASVYVYLIVIGAMIVVPGVCFYAFKDGIKVISMVMGLVGTVLLPILPMILATLLTMPFMNFIGGKKNRNLIMIIGNVLMIAAIVGFQVLMSRMELKPEEMQSVLSSNDGLIAFLGRSFPPSIWLTKMVTGSLTDTIWFILLNLGFVVVLAIMAKLLYKGAMAKYNQQTTNSSGRRKAKISYKSQSKQILLIKRQFGIIFSNPTFMLNTIMTVFLPVLLFAIYLLMGTMTMDTLRAPELKPYIIYIYAAIVSSPCIMGSISATAITRDGKSFWELKVLPITTAQNIKARIYSTWLVNFTASAVMAIFALYLMPVTAIEIAISIVACIISTIFFTNVDFMVNILRPTLNWTNPTAAVKNNFNVMFSFVPRLIVGGVMFLIVKLGPELSAFGNIGVFIGLMFIGSIVTTILLKGPFSIKFAEIES